MSAHWVKVTSEAILGIATIAGGIPAISFPIYYWYKSGGAWKDSNMGRNVMAWSWVMASLYLSGLIRIFVPEEFLQLFVRPALAIGCAIVVIWRFVLFVGLYRDPEPQPVPLSPRSGLMEDNELQPELNQEPELHTDGLLVNEYVNIKAGDLVPCDSGLRPPTTAHTRPAGKAEDPWH